MGELFIRLFGGYTLVDLLSYGWFMLIGYIINALLETTGRDIKSKNTPEKWNWKFWVKDNWRRYIFSVLSTYLLFRFYIELIGHPFSDFEALLVGYTGDGISGNLKRRIKILSANRVKIMEGDEVKSDNKEKNDENKSHNKEENRERII